MQPKQNREVTNQNEDLSIHFKQHYGLLLHLIFIFWYSSAPKLYLTKLHTDGLVQCTASAWLLHRSSVVTLQPLCSPTRYSAGPPSGEAQNWSCQQTWNDFQDDRESSSEGKTGDSEFYCLLFAQKWCRLGQGWPFPSYLHCWCSSYFTFYSRIIFLDFQLPY